MQEVSLTGRGGSQNFGAAECTIFTSAPSSWKSATPSAISSPARSSRSRSRPRGSRRARGRCCMDVLDKASQMGLRTLALSEDAGGAGADNLTCCIVTEELAVGDPDVAAVLAQTSTLAHRAVRPRDDGRAARALPAGVPGGRPLPPGARRARARLRCHARHQLSPPAARANRASRPPPCARAMSGSSTASRTASPTRRSQSCLPCRSSTGAGGVSTLLVPRDTPGLSVAESEREHALAPRRLRRGDVQGLPRARRQSPRRGGARARSPPTRAASIPQDQALNLGIGRAAYEAALDYAQLRVQGGRRIIEHQAIGGKARRGRHPARGRARRDLAGGVGVRPSRRVRRPQPRRSAAHEHRQGVRRRRRSTTPPRMRRNASAPWA